MGQQKCSIEEYQFLGLRDGILNTSDFNPDQKHKVLMALQNAKCHRPSIYTSAKINYNKNLTSRIRKRCVQQQKLKPIFNKLKEVETFKKNEVTKLRGLEDEKLLTSSEQGRKSSSLTNTKDIIRKARNDESHAITLETTLQPETLTRTFGHCVITKEEEKKLFKHLLSLLQERKKAIKEAERKILDDLWCNKVRQRKEFLTIAKETTKQRKASEKTEIGDNQTEVSRKAEETQANQLHDCQTDLTKQMENHCSDAETDVNASSKIRETIKGQEPWRIQHRLLSKKFSQTSANTFYDSLLLYKERPGSCRENDMSTQADLPRLPLTSARQVYIRHGYSEISSVREEWDSFKLPLIEGQDHVACCQNSLCSRYTGGSPKNYSTSCDNAARKNNEEEKASGQSVVQETKHSEKMSAFLPPIYTEHHSLRQSVQTENKQVNKKLLAKNSGKKDPRHHEGDGICRRRSGESNYFPLRNKEDEQGKRKYSITNSKYKKQYDDNKSYLLMSTKQSQRLTTPMRGFTPLSDECFESSWLLGSFNDEKLDLAS